MFSFFDCVIQYFNTAIDNANYFFDYIQTVGSSATNAIDWLTSLQIAPMGFSWIVPVVFGALVFEWLARFLPI